MAVWGFTSGRGYKKFRVSLTMLIRAAGSAVARDLFRFARISRQNMRSVPRAAVGITLLFFLQFSAHSLFGLDLKRPQQIQVIRRTDVQLLVDSSGRDQLDWRQLTRPEASKTRLRPSDFALLWEVSVWDHYRSYATGLVSLLVVEALLILALLAQVRRRMRAEKRLLSEKAFSDAVIESLPGIFFMQDASSKNVRWNKNAEKIVRYHPSEVQSLGNVSEKYRDLVRQKAQEVLETGDSHAEIELLGQGDAIHHYQISAHRVELEGKPYAIGIGIDISERKRAEDELRLSEARFASAFENAPIGVALVSLDGHWIKVNRALCDLLGYTRDELQAMTFMDVTHPDDLQANLEYARQILAGEIRFYQMEKRYFHKSGRLVWVGLSVSLVRDSQGQPLYRISQIQDITERKRADEELKQAEERFAKAFRSNPEGFSISTLSDGRYLEVNESFLRTVGFERSEVIGKTITELGIWEDVEERSAVIAKLRASGAIKDEDVKFRTKAHKIRQVRLSAELIQLQGELCLLGLSRDVTEQNLLEEQLRQAQKMEAVGRLASGIAHEFNNLLGVITGYSELINSSLAPESSTYKRVAAIKQAGQRAASLTTQLLAFSRKQTVSRAVNLNTVVAETGKLLRPLLGEDIEQTVILDPKLGQVKADVGQIVQVIMNLAVNSRDAMRSGGKLTIETANKVVGEGATTEGIPVRPGSYVTLSVRDNGTGMNEETSAHIFEPFYTTKPAGKGTGLGLATVYGIVEQSSGCIVVDTAPGEGTTFTIYLPRTDEAVSSTPEMPVTGQLGWAKPGLVSATVLLVEDELALRGFVDESLRQEGYTVLLAANGLDALRVAERYKGPIHLLITDVIMPFVSGPELARSLKLLRPELRVLYMSGYTADKLADHPKLDPDLALLQKPFRLADLAQKVRDLLNDKGTEGASAKGAANKP
jgi:PAS domain S-box-containing protein